MRHNFHTHPCPKCGAAVGAPCVSRNGNAQPWNAVHVLRLRYRHYAPADVPIYHTYPKRPKAIGIMVLSPLGVQVLIQLVRGQ